jgi:ABC-type cobalamin/Fe3+-siderophores transport system ATPase subunit
MDDNFDSSESDQELKTYDEVAGLARRLTSKSIVGTLFPPHGALDPYSPEFNARQWFKAFFQSRIDASDGVAPKRTGVVFNKLNVHGFGTATDFQKTAGNIILDSVSFAQKLMRTKQNRVDILHGDFEGRLNPGEMLAVLGPPGSGCTTFLRTISGETHGFKVAADAEINYDGIPFEQMHSAYRGEVIYTAEVDTNLPNMTVADTLYFAARARLPRNIPDGVSRSEYAEHLRDVIMALFGISHTKNTRVGNDYIRGVSGGERKRVTIAEASLAGAPVQCWDNSTRGLDSANAIEFCRSLRIQADVMGTTACVAIYQAPEAAYKV